MKLKIQRILRTWYSLGSRSRSVKAEIGTRGISSVNTFTILSSKPNMSANLNKEK